MSRLVLWLAAVTFVPFGIWVLADPTGLAAMTERTVATPTAMTESRAVDGGLLIGLGIFFAACALDPTRTRAGLLAMLLTLGGPFLGRLVGVALDGATAGTLQAAGFELALGALAAIALMRDARPLGGRHP